MKEGLLEDTEKILGKTDRSAKVAYFCHLFFLHAYDNCYENIAFEAKRIILCSTREKVGMSDFYSG